MPKSTPGPWRVRNCQTAVLVDVVRNGEAMLIALVADNDTEGDTETDRKLNNARLMAAAPEMLDLLKKIADWPFPFLSGKGIDEVRELAGEMVKKVEGEA
jgi:hypothetical protein